MTSAFSSTFVAGLPGKNIRPSPDARQGRFAPPKHAASRPSPLGISINTNLQSSSPLPRQVFPLGQDVSRQPSQARPRKRKPNLKLSDTISPFDREIPICISPNTLGGTPGLPGTARLSAHMVQTPCIIITPTEEEFGQSSPLPRPQDLGRHYGGLSPNATHGPRIASSVYSPARRAYSSNQLGTGWRSRSGSVTTIIEDDGESPEDPPRKSRSFSLDSVLATPRRSVGWWNLMASPVPRRSSTKSSKRAAKNAEADEDRAPLVTKASEMDGTSEHDLARLDDPNTRRQVEESHFYHYWAPMNGEAVKYYDPAFDMSTPLLDANIQESSSPEPASPTRSVDYFSPVASHSERGTPALSLDEDDSVREISKKVPLMTVPSGTPPKSSIAAMGEHWHTPAIISTKRISVTPPAQGAASPFSPSPVVGTAQVKYFQTARPPQAKPQPVNQDQTMIPLAGSTPPMVQARSDTPVNYTPGYADLQKNDPGPVSQQPLAKVVFDPRATPEFYPAPSGHASTLARSPHGSTRHLASPFETPFQYQKQGLRPPLQTFPEKKSWREDPYHRSVDAEPVKKHRSRRCLAWTSERWLCIAISILLFVLVALSVILAMTLTGHHSFTPVEVKWLNLTGYPPMPTGISTIAQPNVVTSAGDCVDTPNMWSCAIPKEQQSVLPNNGPAPSLRIEITFNQDTITNSSTIQPAVEQRAMSGSSITARGGILAKRGALSTRDTFNNILFSPNPSPPGTKEQSFLGNTTDNNTVPYDGERTPFYISILPTSVPSNTSQFTKRAFASNSSTIANIPSPDLLTNGTIAPAQLYPFASAQPLRLFNRGLATEHYSFYSYFSRSIFLAANSSSTNTTSAFNDVNTNANGGALLSAANTVCTFSQTRFLVQIWTRQPAALISSTNNLNASNTSYSIPASNTSSPSAFDFSTPGSFPYPVTITIDRHGGSAKDKGVFCYGLNAKGQVIKEQKLLVNEDRASGGESVNAADGAFQGVNGDVLQRYGGVDGGSGGCKCQWQNFGS